MADFPTFTGKWQYQSFCPKPGSKDRSPQIAAPWSPRGMLSVETHPQTGAVTGELIFSPSIKLALTGKVAAATADLPESLELSAEGLDSISTLRGFFLQGGNLVAGIVVALRNDPAMQPAGTHGAFVMFPLSNELRQTDGAESP